MTIEGIIGGALIHVLTGQFICSSRILRHEKTEGLVTSFLLSSLSILDGIKGIKGTPSSGQSCYTHSMHISHQLVWLVVFAYVDRPSHS
jgi:hypothetical protein